MRLLRLLLRAARPGTDFGFGPGEDRADFCPAPVSVDRSPLLRRSDFVNSGVPPPPEEDDHFVDFNLFGFWALAC